MTKKTAPVAPARDDYEIQQDLHHLTQAHKIKKDPKRHKAALAMARAKMQELKEATSMSPKAYAADQAADAKGGPDNDAGM